MKTVTYLFIYFYYKEYSRWCEGQSCEAKSCEAKGPIENFDLLREEKKKRKKITLMSSAFEQHDVSGGHNQQNRACQYK